MANQGHYLNQLQKHTTLLRQKKLTLGNNSALTNLCSCLMTLMQTVLIANGSQRIIAMSLVR